MVILSNEPINPETVSNQISFPQNTGSVVTHFAIVKPVIGGRSTSGIRFEASGDVESELQTLETNLRRDWNLLDIVLIRRLGVLGIRDVISVALVAADNREAAFGACREAVEEFKTMRTIKKREMEK